MSGSRSYLILAINDRERTIADWQARQGRDWVDQMLLGGMLKCAEHGYRLIVELIDTHSDHVERELLGAIGALRPDGIILTPPTPTIPRSCSSWPTSISISCASGRRTTVWACPFPWMMPGQRNWPRAIWRAGATGASR
jgi:hypothetical protein